MWLHCVFWGLFEVYIYCSFETLVEGAVQMFEHTCLHWIYIDLLGCIFGKGVMSCISIS